MRYILITLGLLLILGSCSHADQSSWGDWEHRGVAEEKREWRECSLQKDGPEYDGKGYCFITRHCRTRKKFLGFEETECRNEPLFCAYQDLECISKHKVKIDQINP